MLVTRFSQLMDTSAVGMYYFLAQEEKGFWDIIVDIIATTDSLLAILTVLGFIGGGAIIAQGFYVVSRSVERAHQPIILPDPFEIRYEIGLRMIVGFFIGAFIGWIVPHTYTINTANDMFLGWLITDENIARWTTAILGAIVVTGLGLASANRNLAMLIGALIGGAIGSAVTLTFSLPTVWTGPVIIILAVAGLVVGRKISPREEGETNRGGILSLFAPILRLAVFVGLLAGVGIGFFTLLGGQVENETLPLPSPSASMVAFVTTNETNIRSGPGIGYQTLALADQGERVMLQGRIRQAANGDTWSQVEFEGTVGWVHRNLLRCNLSQFCGR